VAVMNAQTYLVCASPKATVVHELHELAFLCRLVSSGHASIVYQATPGMMWIVQGDVVPLYMPLIMKGHVLAERTRSRQKSVTLLSRCWDVKQAQETTKAAGDEDASIM